MAHPAEPQLFEGKKYPKSPPPEIIRIVKNAVKEAFVKYPNTSTCACALIAIVALIIRSSRARARLRVEWKNDATEQQTVWHAELLATITKKWGDRRNYATRESAPKRAAPVEELKVKKGREQPQAKVR